MPDSSSLQRQDNAQPAIACPYCGSNETEFFSLFGAQLLTAQYYCRACHTPFEQVKSETVLADAARRDLAGESQQARESQKE